MKIVLPTLLTVLLLAACSGVETIPDDTATFSATQYTRYAWRSEPMSQQEYSKDKMQQADPIVRATVEKRLAELGYQQVAKKQAEFLVEYVAGPGFNAGILAGSATNVNPNPTAAIINRQPDGASVDNAYALAGLRETGNIVLVFVDRASTDLLWRVQISALIEDANRVDEGSVRSAILKGLSTLPPAQ